MNGYFRHPTVFKNQVVFVSEDDLWCVDLGGGVARRLTAGLGAAALPVFSADGQRLAFSSEEEGHREIFICDALGGEAQRLTYLGDQANPVCWREGELIFRSNARHAHSLNELFRISLAGGLPEPLNLGPATRIAFSESGEVILEHNSHRADPAHWKRYRGGTAGVFWTAQNLDSPFHKFLNLKSNLSRPMWIGNRVYFLSDHEGIGNIYSSDKKGQSLIRHTNFKDYYCRNPQTDGQNVVFHAGGDLFRLDVRANKVAPIVVDYRSQRTQRQRKFVPAAKHLEHFALSPKGDQVQVTTRGQAFAFGNWEGPVFRYGQAPATRYRLGDWLADGKTLAVVSDEGGTEHLELFPIERPAQSEKIDFPDMGRVTYMKASPKGNFLAFTNHANQLWVVNLDNREPTLVDRAEHSQLQHFEWSPDGRMIAYSKSKGHAKGYLKIYVVAENRSHAITKPFLLDFEPTWDPDGRYLYFLSTRILDPVYDNVQFELSFPRGIVPCLVTLRRDLPSPFLNAPKNESKDTEKDSEKDKTEPKPIEVHFDEIEKRVVAFPVNDGRYVKIKGLSGGKVAWALEPIKGTLNRSWLSSEPVAENRLEVFDFETRKAESFGPAISDFDVNSERSHLLIKAVRDLRVLKVGEKPDDKESRTTFTKKSGWIDLNRARLLVEPAQEWRQMLHEIWRLQRDHYWDEAMAKIDWAAVLPRYSPLVERVNTRSEFSDLAWELQGELGTSHAYDIGGDYRRPPHYGVGQLGADFAFDSHAEGFRLVRILESDQWNLAEGSPLGQLGVNMKPGDLLISINGQRLSPTLTPSQALFHRADDEVEIEFVAKESGQTLCRRIKTVGRQFPARYRDWVESNRAYVSRLSKGRVGYVHIPDMGARGFSEFHRSFLRDYDQDALIVDVRFNGGGHVSQLLLEKLARQRLGLSYSRWVGTFPEPYESPAGPLVAITNEHAGSDGDIFSHTFKMRQLGPLIGKRTWGGVIGINPRHPLVDGSITTQPEYATWFSDVGFKLENYGVEPTIEVDFAPHDYRKGHDPQLARAIEEALRLIEVKPPFKPVPVKDLDFRAPEMS